MAVSSHPPRWLTTTLLCLSLAVAAGLRLYRLPALPLGLHYDEAANVILAARIARGEACPVFIPSYTGKEVLFFYWAAAWMRLLGEGVLALRLTSAVAGLCTVAASAWSAYELLHRRRDAAWLGALTAAFVATSFWHLLLSRYGFRAVTQPLLQALTVAALWRGLRLERRGWLLLAGVLCGATAYTYLAARAFPLPLGLALLTLLLADRGQRRARLGQLGLFLAAAAGTVAPLAAYFATHPAALTTRMSQVAASSWSEAWAGFRACLGMFFLRGDPYIRFNLPGLPLLDPFTAALFGLGVILVMVGIARAPLSHPSGERSSSLHLAALVFLLAVLPTMLLPSALATGDITPSNLRAVGLLPFLYILPALALARIAGYLSRLAPRARRALYLLLALPPFLLTPLTAARYFRDWATSAALYDTTDGDMADVAAYLNQSDLSGVTPYVASIHYRHPTLAALADDYPTLRWLTGGETVVLPASGDGLLLLPRSADGALNWLGRVLPDLPLLAAPLAPDGAPAFRAYRLPAGTVVTPTHPLSANFGGAATLLGYDLLSPPRSGGTVEALLYWRVTARPEPGDLMPAVRLADPWGGWWGETRPFHYPAEQWTPGEVVMDHLSIPVAPGAPPGTYYLQFGFYASSTGASLPLLDATGGFAGTVASLPVTLTWAAAPPDPTDLGIRRRLDLTTPFGVALLGANLDTTEVRPGERLYLTLFWQADRVPDPLTVRLSLGGVTLTEGAPVHDTLPTPLWPASALVADRYDPRLPRDAAPGDFPLLLTLLDAGGQPLLETTLGQVTVQATERNFTPPPLTYPVGVPLGGLVELVGYDLEPAQPVAGAPLTVTLYWQALTETETSFTVFTHLLDSNGMTVAQHDGLPAGGGYPTPLWVAGEVVADAHRLDLPAGLPPGTYTLEVGLYRAEDGTRLAVPGSPDGAVRFSLTVQAAGA